MIGRDSIEERTHGIKGMPWLPIANLLRGVEDGAVEMVAVGAQDAGVAADFFDGSEAEFLERLVEAGAVRKPPGQVVVAGLGAADVEHGGLGGVVGNDLRKYPRA